jgi:hypothetical protein
MDDRYGKIERTSINNTVIPQTDTIWRGNEGKEEMRGKLDDPHSPYMV